jgi:hypothetical protein
MVPKPVFAIAAAAFLLVAIRRHKRPKARASPVVPAMPPDGIDEASELAKFDMASLTHSLDFVECMIQFSLANDFSDAVLSESLEFFVLPLLPDERALRLVLLVIEKLKSSDAPQLPYSRSSLFVKLGHLYRAGKIDMPTFERIHDAMLRRHWRPSESDQTAMWHALCVDMAVQYVAPPSISAPPRRLRRPRTLR